MDALSFLSPSADNLFKFLFLNGLVMIAVGLLYPLQKSNELEIKILEYNKKIAHLEQDIIGLRDDSKNLNAIVFNRINLAKSLVNKRKSLDSKIAIDDINNQITELKLKTNLSYQEIKKNENIILKNQVNLTGEKKVIETLNKQIKVYDLYCFWFSIVGIFFGVIGFVGWLCTTVFCEYPNYKNFNEKVRKAKMLERRRKAIKAKANNQISQETAEDIQNS